MTTPPDNKTVPSHAWFTERRNLTLLILAAFLFLSLTTFFLCYEHDKSATEQALKEDRATANLASLILEEHLQIIIKTMESYANRPLLLQAVREKNVEKAREHLYSLTKNTPGIDSVLITDSHGTLWSNYSLFPEVLGKNFAHRDWYRSINKDWKPYVSDALLRVVGEKDLAVTVGVPLIDEKGKVIGILANTQRMIKLSKIIQRVSLGPGSSISVTDRKGNLVYSSRFVYDKKITPYPFYSLINDARAGKNQSFVVEDPLFGGMKRYISFASVAGHGWSVFVGRDSGTILQSGSAFYIQTTAISVLLFLLITVFLIYIRKQAITQQIMDRLRAEKEFQASELRFRELFDMMRSGVAIYQARDDGEDFIILDLNEAGQKITHVYTDFIGKSVCDVFPGVKELGLFQVFQQVWKTGKEEFYPATPYKDGHLTFWVENWVYKLPSGEIVAVFDDMTEQMRAEETLRESNESQRTLIQGSPVAVIVLDTDGNVTLWNPAAEKMFGWCAEEVLGKFLPYFPKDKLNERNLLREKIRGGNTFLGVELRRQRKDGASIDISVSTAPFHDATGKIVGAMSMSIDITDRKRADEKLAEQLDELRRWHEATLGREMRILDLKREVNELLAEDGRPPRYARAEPDAGEKGP
ncbi:MAG: PAS domain S-box protein [Pseudomonadota bacterium]